MSAAATLSPQRAGTQLLKLWRAAMGDRLPVDVSLLALEWSKQIAPDAPIGEVQAVEIEDFEGMLSWLPTRRKWALLYHPRPNVPGRANFTMAHELGHFAMHRQLQTSFRCSQSATLGYGGPNERNIEREADLFASYLLMPIDDFKNAIANRRITLEVLSECALRYGVSLTAAILKWLDFSEKSAALVFSREGMIDWWRCTTSARPLAFGHLQRGTEIPEESFAATPDRVLDRNEYRTGMMLPSGVWFPNHAVREMLVVSDRYDMTISLLIIDDAGVVHEDDADNASSNWEPPSFR